MMTLKYQGIYILKASEDTCWQWKMYFIFKRDFDWKGFTIT